MTMRLNVPLLGEEEADAVRAVLLDWLEDQSVAALSLICMSLTQQMFADYLTQPPEGTP